MFYETKVEVDAPPRRVWEALVDVTSWPRWTDSIESVELLDGTVAVGATARVKQPKIRPAVWRVDEMEPGRSFVWSSTTGGVTSTGGHYVRPVDEQRSELLLTFHQRGLLAPLTGLFYGKLCRQYVDMEAAGLRRCAEQSSLG